MKMYEEIMDELKDMAAQSPIVFQTLRMQQMNNTDDLYTLATMALCLAKALKESQEKHLDAEMRAWPRVII